MPSYKNLMESVVENLYDEIEDTLDCCHCERCRNDVISYALNQLPPKYVISLEGELFSKLQSISSQHSTDILSALATGARLVKERPRHAASEK